MELFRRFLAEAATEAAGEQTGSLDSMGNMMQILLLVLLVGAGVYALYSAIRLHREQMLFPNKFLYPGDCKPEDCADVGGFIDFILPRTLLLGASMLVMGVALALNTYVFLLDALWIDIAMLVLPFGVFLWYIIAQRKAAKRFW